MFGFGGEGFGVFGGGGGGGNPLGFIGDAVGLAGQNYYNKKAASKDRAFQRWVLRNKHQQIAKDMEDAGLNRILAIPDSGAMPSPSGIGVSQPQMGSTSQRLASAKESDAKADQAEENTRLLEQTQQKIDAEIALLQEQGRLTGAEADKQVVMKRFYEVIAPAVEEMTRGLGQTLLRTQKQLEKFLQETDTDPVTDQLSIWIGDFIDWLKEDSPSKNDGKPSEPETPMHPPIQWEFR